MTEKVYDIGLVMAGAISAGAYTAGVIDFLFEALQEWEKAKQAGEADCPKHKVNIKVLSGTSAGGMTAAMAAAAICGDQLKPIRTTDQSSPSGNTIYDCWVDKIDIKHLLKTGDLNAEDAVVTSLLNSNILSDIADYAMDQENSTNKWPAFVDENLQLMLSVTNLKGVPYKIDMQGGPAHEMQSHADYMHFVLSDTPTDMPAAIWLNKNNFDAPAWDQLGMAALATGAFPIGLAPRRLKRRSKEYSERHWKLHQPSENGRCSTEIKIPPNWDLGDDDYYEFLAVDGGVMNNEPLEFARKVLRGKNERNPREGDRAKGSVIMIDPFPDGPTFNDEPISPELFSVIGNMFNSLKNEARFKPEELALAQDPKVFSRFLISPTRYKGDNSAAEYAMACGSLGGFGGFLSRKFRDHDYQLGRRNCQRFLSHWFVVKPGNELVKDWTPGMDLRFGITADRKTIGTQTAAYRPIIPLFGSATEEIPVQRWPKYTRGELEELEDQIEARATAVFRALIEQYYRVPCFIPILFRFGWWIKKDKIVGKIIKKITSDLKKRELMTKSD